MEAPRAQVLDEVTRLVDRVHEARSGDARGAPRVLGHVQHVARRGARVLRALERQVHHRAHLLARPVAAQLADGVAQSDREDGHQHDDGGDKGDREHERDALAPAEEPVARRLLAVRARALADGALDVVRVVWLHRRRRRAVLTHGRDHRAAVALALQRRLLGARQLALEPGKLRRRPEGHAVEAGQRHRSASY
ncbi:MAG: hypothetical protein CL844_03540 [Crocinitomicaceae bacterium]|nr:hypothetical protein [Crocinitomicaceae bacterium]